MRRIGLTIFMLALGATSPSAQEGPGTKFRGFYVNMTIDEARTSKLDGFNVEFDAGRYAMFKALTANRKGADRNGACGAIAFDADGRLSEMFLSKCFFDGDDLNDEQFAQSIVDAYQIDKLECAIEPPDPSAVMLWRQLPIGPAPTPKKICSGPAKTGEWLKISGGRIQIERRTTAQRPKFD